ncbi:glycine cleavage system protein GcvH [Kitasatospora sp. NPDC006697]|uniref:glycine cleavage system protein GcvH n=1 Tax=Kitasatospora sp. NPDC006697 TaxID=3364020 RepID=UPI003689F626
MPYPTEFKYTREHEWVLLRGGTARVGLTDYAQKQLGDVVFVELPKVGESMAAGQMLGTVESVKAASEIYAPVTGKVTAVNEELGDEPELINSDAHDAWVAEIEIKDAKELDGLLSAAQYEAYLAEEGA